MTPVPVFSCSYRRAQVEDVSAIVKLVNSAYRGELSRLGWTTEADILDGQRTDENEVLKLIEADKSITLLCINGKDIIGSIHLTQSEDFAHIGMFVIHPLWQGIGIGKQFLAFAEHLIFSKWNLRKIKMAVITIRTELIAYYERRGYHRTNELKKFPQDPRFGIQKIAGIELVILEKNLT